MTIDIETHCMKKTSSITRGAIKKAVTQSSKMEGNSFARAKKNGSVIRKLKRYGRAFSV